MTLLSQNRLLNCTTNIRFSIELIFLVLVLGWAKKSKNGMKKDGFIITGRSRNRIK